MSTKTWIVTGGSSGLGASITESIITGQHIPQGFHDHVVIFARNFETAKQYAEALEKHEKKKEGAKISVVRCDMTSFKSIDNAVKDLKDLGITQLDVIIYNAGLTGSNAVDSKLTEDGFDKLFQTNVLGLYYLNQLLLPLIPSGKIVFVGSNFTKKVTRDEFRSLIKGEARGFSVAAGNDYGASKWSVGVITHELANKFKDSNPNLAFYCVHPGLVHSKAYENFYGVVRVIMKHVVYPLFGISTQQGAENVLHPITAEIPSGTILLEKTVRSPQDFQDNSWLIEEIVALIPAIEESRF